MKKKDLSIIILATVVKNQPTPAPAAPAAPAGPSAVCITPTNQQLGQAAETQIDRYLEQCRYSEADC